MGTAMNESTRSAHDVRAHDLGARPPISMHDVRRRIGTPRHTHTHDTQSPPWIVVASGPRTPRPRTRGRGPPPPPSSSRSCVLSAQSLLSGLLPFGERALEVDVSLARALLVDGPERAADARAAEAVFEHAQRCVRVPYYYYYRALYYSCTTGTRIPEPSYSCTTAVLVGSYMY